MTKEEILIELKQLPMHDKMAVLAILTRLVEVESEDDSYKAMVDRYVSTMKKLVGDDFMKSNKHENVQAKVVMSICMLEGGMTVMQIGRVLDRDHSTVSSYKKTWSYALTYPRVYKDMIDLYNKYKKEL